MERLNLLLDDIEIEQNLDDLDDYQISELIYLLNGEKERREIRKKLIREMTQRILENTVYVEDWSIYDEEEEDY